MIADLADKIKHLPERKQRVLFFLGFLVTIGGFVAALSDWTDAMRPGFIGACVVALGTDYINYTLGRKTDE